MIRKATYKDIDSILILTKACTVLMIENGVFQWNDQYPNKSIFEIDIQRSELYVLENKSSLIGCIVISKFMDEDYVPIKWLTPNKNNIYIHRLAIHPNHQGKGYAKQLMDFAELLAVTTNFQSIRLDTFSRNKRNQKFYELRNYKKLGKVYFTKQSKHPFYCYELVL